MVLIMILGVVGCSLTRHGVFEESHVKLPLPRVADNSFAFDIFFAHVASDPQFDERLWAEIDEQALDPDLRRQLMVDGIRCGLVEAQLPKNLEQILDEAEPPTQQELPQPADEANPSSLGPPGANTIHSTAGQNRRIFLRAGRHAELVTSSVREKITILRRTENAVSGTTFADAQTAFRLKAVDAGNGQTLVSLLPEVQHGPPRTRFTGRDGGLSLSASRESDAFEELKIQVPMEVGQTLIVTSSDEPLTIGGNFFQCDDPSRPQRKWLLVRLVWAGQERMFEDPHRKLTIDDL